MEQKPEDIPKEELLQLCMKLNKRMQAMETKGKEILKKKNSLQIERQKLLGLIEAVVHVPLQPSPAENDLDFTVVETAWNDWDRTRREHLVGLEQKVQSFEAGRSAIPIIPPPPRVDTNLEADLLGLESMNETSIPAPEAGGQSSNTSALVEENAALQSKCVKAEAEIERLKNVESYLKNQFKTLENVIIDKTKEMEALQKDLEAMRLSSEEKVVHFQMQLNQSKTREEAKSNELQTMKSELEKLMSRVGTLSNVKEEKETLLEHNKEMIVALQSRIMEVEPEVVQLRDKVKDHERRYSALQLLKVEQDNVLGATQRELKNAIAEKEALLQKVHDLEETRVKSESQSVKLTALGEEINNLKEEIEEKSAIIMRLRTEAQTSERNHAMRTAMLATCEAQVETLQKELATKDETTKDALERVSSLQISLAALEARLDERTQEAARQITSLEEEQESQRRNYTQLLRAKEVEQQEAIEAAKRDYGKKSAMARQLLSEREEEVRVLSTKVRELQEEIASGAPTERKIFELAQVQSRRDALNGVHRDTREVAFQQLQMKLAAKDYELAQAQQNLHQLGHEVLELRKVKQREGINMDYLKNVILQYMTFPIQSSERLALVPVIAMLLQFSPKEMMDVQQAIRDPSFGARIVKEVKRIEASTKVNSATSSGSSGNMLSSSSSSSRNVVNGGNRSSSAYAPPSSTTHIGNGRPPLGGDESSKASQQRPITGSVPASLSDQDLQEKLRMISGDILNLSTMSQDDIESRLGMLTPSTESALSPENNKR